jgi:hypothetical protein
VDKIRIEASFISHPLCCVADKPECRAMIDMAIRFVGNIDSILESSPSGNFDRAGYPGRNYPRVKLQTCDATFCISLREPVSHGL